MSVMERVESVSKASRARSYISFTFTGGIDRLADLDHWLRLVFPTARGLEATLEIAHAGKVLIEPVAIAGTDFALQIFRLVSNGVENASASIEFANLRF